MKANPWPIIFDLVKARPIYSCYMKREWNWLATDWPSFWQTHIFTILWFALWKQKWWPICGQSFLTSSKRVLYTLVTWKGNEIDWPQIGHHFGKPIYSLYYGSLCGSKNDGQSVANHFWLCQSESYILLLLEKRMKLIGHRLAIIFASAERTIV